jgi:ribosomal protein L7/L12
MQLMRLADVPLDPRDRVFYYSRLRAVTGATLLAVVAIAAFVFAWLKDAWPMYYIGALMALCLLIYQRLIIGRFRSSNWLLRMTDHGLLVKFRSYLNHPFAAQDLTVVFVPYSEIRSARLVKERQELPDRDQQSGTTASTRRTLELELAGNITEFAEALGMERERVFTKSHRGAEKISTRYHHFPVRRVLPTVLRIEWGVVPSIQTILDALTRHTLVQSAAEATKNYANLDQLSRQEQETRLVELAESGDMIGAIAIARRLYSYDLTAAKQFVEGLMSKQPARR